MGVYLGYYTGLGLPPPKGKPSSAGAFIPRSEAIDTRTKPISKGIGRFCNAGRDHIRHESPANMGFEGSYVA
jgi:hypothetical protein